MIGKFDIGFFFVCLLMVGLTVSYGNDVDSFNGLSDGIEGPSAVAIEDNGPSLVLMEDITVCSGTPIFLADLPIEDQNGSTVNYSYHTETPPTTTNEIQTESVVITANDTIYVVGTSNGCSTELEVPMEFVTSPILVLQTPISVCKGQDIVMSEVDVIDLELTGSPISFHTDAIPTPQNIITTPNFTPIPGQSIYAFSELGLCEYILPININVINAPDLFITTQPVMCTGEDLVLGSLLISDLNNSGIGWTYHNQLPGTPQNEITETVLNFSSDAVFYAVATLGGCLSELTIEVTVTSSLYAGEDNMEIACANTGLFDLNDLITPAADPGTFMPSVSVPYFNGVTNTFDLNSAPPGIYNFDYLVAGNGSCLQDQATVQLEVLQATNAGEDTTVELCEGTTDLIDMHNFLYGANGTDGTWRQLTGAPVNLTNPQAVDFSNAASDTIIFQFILDGVAPCIKDTAVITLDLTPAPTMGGSERRCSADLTTYTYAFWTEHEIVGTDFGTVVDAGTEFQIENVPIAQTINVTLRNDKGCEKIVTVTPPDCDCAYVPNPTIVESVYACAGDAIPPLSIVLPLGYAANWYDSSQGGTLLFGNGTSFSPGIVTPGAYTYYVEVYSSADPTCISESRTEVIMEIYDYPPSTSLALQGCITDQSAEFDFAVLVEDIYPGENYEYIFYNTMADAMSETNGLPTMHSIPTSQLGDIFAVITVGGICSTIVEVNLSAAPNPDVDFYVQDVSCGDDPDGQVVIIVNDPAQDLEASFNFSPWSTSIFEITGLFGGNYGARVRNEFGCVVSEILTIETYTGFELTTFEFECNGNNTPADPTDDYQVLQVQAESTSGSTGFDLYNGTDYFGSYPFGVLHTINLPADGTYYSLDFIDQLNADCKQFFVLGELSTCSTQCGITSVEVVGANCEDNGTPYDPFDDIYYLQVEVKSVNSSLEWVIDGQTPFIGEYGIPIEIGPFSMADRDSILLFQDRVSSDCFYELEYEIPDPCSTQCEVNFTEINVIECDDSFTGPIITDDAYYVTLIGANRNLGKEEFMIDLLGQVSGPHRYDEIIEFPGVVANDVVLTIIMYDVDDPMCVDSSTVILTPCSQCIETSEILIDTINLNCINEPIPAETDISLSGTYDWVNLDNGNSVSTDLDYGFDNIGEYGLYVNHDNLCTSADTFQVTQENVIPEAIPGIAQILTCRDTVVTISGSTIHPSDIQFEWFDENQELVGSQDSLDITQLGIYTLIVEDTLRKCVSVPVQVEVTQDTVDPNFSFNTMPGDTLTCFDPDVEIMPNEDATDFSFSWLLDSQEVTTSSISVVDAGVYGVEIINDFNGCIQVDSLEIFADADIPVIAFEFPDTLNCINDEIIIDATGSTMYTTTAYEWAEEDLVPIAGQSDQTLTVGEGGYYHLTIFDSANGCQENDSIFIVFDRALPDLMPGADDYLRCFESSYTLNGLIENIEGEYLSNWSNSEGLVIDDPEALVTDIYEPGTYLWSVMNTINYCASVDSVIISEDPHLITGVDVVVQDPFCYLDENGMIVINEVYTGGTDLNIELDGAASPDETIYADMVGGEYLLEIINAEGCTFDTLLVMNDPEELSLSFSVDDAVVINLGDSLFIESYTNIAEQHIGDVYWSGGQNITFADQLNTTIYPINSTTFELAITDINGCEISRSISVKVTEDIFLYFPNVFNPTNEQDGTEFMIHGDRQVDEIETFEIFDRWGNRIFESSNFTPGELGMGWDGRVGGVEAAVGVYVYKVYARLKNGKYKSYFGDVTIVK